MAVSLKRVSGRKLYEDILVKLLNKADKATTLAGYGVTDAFTKTETEELLEDVGNSVIWTASEPPTTPNYTFAIADLTGSGTTPKEGDVILHSYYIYTISSVSTTTVLASERTSIRGEQGVSIASVTNYYLATSASSGVTRQDPGWTTTIQTMTSTNQYLWNYEVVSGDNGSTISTSNPIIIGRYGQDGQSGASGKGITSIVEHYQKSSSNSVAPSTWSLTPVNTDETDRYLWNYETINYTDNTHDDTDARVISVHGARGSRGATWYAGTAITGTSTTPTAFPNSGVVLAIEGDRYINSTTQNVYLCTTGGDASTALWKYEQNIKGSQGSQGDPGQGMYIHVKYSDDGGQTFTGNSGEDPGNYIGIKVDSNQQDPTVVSAYDWTRVRGDELTTSRTGSTTKIYINGTESASVYDGENGYVHVAWADSITIDPNTGVVTATGFSTSTATGKQWLGSYTDNIETSSQTAGDYKWVLIKGAAGNDGVSVTSVQTQYNLSTVSSGAPDGTWSDEQAPFITGRYYWTRDKITYSNGTTGYSTAIYNQGLTLANEYALSANTAAQQADESAQSAMESATEALNQLSVVEDIIGVLNLISKNGVYALTQDLEIQPSKWYFKATGTAVSNPTGDPHAQGWYELSSGIYSLTDDTTVTSGKTYYTLTAQVVDVGFDYILTRDTDIVEGKTYYTRSGSGTEQDPYVYTEVENPVQADLGNYYEYTNSPAMHNYYELVSIDEAIHNYVSSHLTLADGSLFLQTDEGDTSTRLELNTTDGMILYDQNGNRIAQYGERAVVGEESGFHITIDPKYEFVAVTPSGTENPKASGWYELVSGEYVLTDDTTVQSGTTYYEPNGRLSFYRDSVNEVAYISGDKLYITQSVVLQQMDIGETVANGGKGQWSWCVHEINNANNLYLKWLG